MEEQNNITIPNEENKQKYIVNPRLKAVLKWLYRLVAGALIGVGAILPGISGGVLCVVFGIYEPMMAFLAHPFRTFKTHAMLLLPVLIGCVLGFVGLAKLVDLLLTASENIAIWLFIGLIAGMVPSMFKEAGKQGRTKKAWITLVVSTVLILTLLLIIPKETKVVLEPNIWWFFVCGILWAISLVVPGLSTSSLMIYLGIYQPMTAGIAKASPEVILPMVVGIVVTVLLLARAIDFVLKKHHSIAFHMILGFVAASTIAIVPLNFKDTLDVILCMVCFVLGFFGAWLMDRVGKRMRGAC